MHPPLLAAAAGIQLRRALVSTSGSVSPLLAACHACSDHSNDASLQCFDGPSEWDAAPVLVGARLSCWLARLQWPLTSD